MLFYYRLVNRVSELETNSSQLKVELDEECKRRKSETEMLAKKLAEKVKQVEVMNQKTLDAENEVQVRVFQNVHEVMKFFEEISKISKMQTIQNQFWL